MSENNMQDQINELNTKVDIILEEVVAQRNARNEKADLISDLSIVGKDIFAHTVTSLDKAGVELDGEALTALLIKLVRNIGTFNQMMDTLESATDMIKDAAPIVNQMGLDAISKFAEFEQKGYLNLMKELINLSDNIVSLITVEDIIDLSDNIVVILETAKSMKYEQIPKYSMWKAFRAMQSPEMKKGIGFIITFIKKLSSAMLNKTEK
ncbi:MAG: DUF1641 domain-containing protein [Bacteroidales bacterium]|nr:DUF1641 domain-containing protein [Bacteroidales bacterium]